jgi:membrane-associated phospholipid phosphatase
VIEIGSVSPGIEGPSSSRVALRARSRVVQGGTPRLLMIGLASLVLFAALALAVRRGAVDMVDDAITWRVQRAAAERLYRLGKVLSLAGGGAVEAPLVLAVSVGLMLAGRPRAALALLAALVGVTAIEVASKQLLMIDRTDAAGLLRAPPSAMPGYVLGLLPSVPEVGYPSGHMARATLLLGLAAAWAWRIRAPLPRVLILLPALGTLALMALTRLALPGEHTPSDVVGGYLLGLAFLSACLAVSSATSSASGEAPRG